MFAEIIAKQDSGMKTLTASIDQSRAETRQWLKEQHTQCVERWQLHDTQLTKLEDENIHRDAQLTNQRTVNDEVSGCLSHLEKEVISICSDLFRLSTQYRNEKTSDISQIFAPMSSTLVPPVTSSNSNNSIPRPHMPTIEQMSLYPNSTKSFFVVSQHRLEDIVPEFNGDIETVHPEKCLRQLDIYFSQVYLSPVQQILEIQRRLIGTALDWYETLTPAPNSYDEFRVSFRQYFWSTITQRRVRNEFYRPYQYTSTVGLEAHARSWMLKARYVSPPIEQEEMVDIIIQHFPYNLGLALRGRGPSTTQALLTLLR